MMRFCMMRFCLIWVHFWTMFSGFLRPCFWRWWGIVDGAASLTGLGVGFLAEFLTLSQHGFEPLEGWYSDPVIRYWLSSGREISLQGWWWLWRLWFCGDFETFFEIVWWMIWYWRIFLVVYLGKVIYTSQEAQEIPVLWNIWICDLSERDILRYERI